MEQEIQPGQMILEAAGGSGDYAPVPLGEPLKGHIDNIRIGTGRNFDTGEPETVLIINVKLDEEIEGRGQVYTKWVKPSNHEKSSLGKLWSAAFGELPQRFDPYELVGRPIRFVLRGIKNKAGEDRSVVESFFPPAKGQIQQVAAAPAKDTVITEADVEAAFGPDGKIDVSKIPF